MLLGTSRWERQKEGRERDSEVFKKWNIARKSGKSGRKRRSSW